MAFLAGGLVLLCFATADRSISLAAAAGLLALVLVHLVSRPGADGVATPAAGAWVAAAGAVLALAGAAMSDPADAVVAPEVPVWGLPR